MCGVMMEFYHPVTGGQIDRQRDIGREWGFFALGSVKKKTRGNVKKKEHKEKLKASSLKEKT
jgi:hypothetical protein